MSHGSIKWFLLVQIVWLEVIGDATNRVAGVFYRGGYYKKNRILPPEDCFNPTTNTSTISNNKNTSKGAHLHSDKNNRSRLLNLVEGWTSTQ